MDAAAVQVTEDDLIGHSPRRRRPGPGRVVLGAIEPPSYYDVTVTVARDGGYLPGPAEFAVAAGQAHRAGPPAS